MKRTLLGGVGLVVLLAGAAPEKALDDFEDLSAWKAAPSDGVRLSIGQAEGYQGRAMRLDFDFQGGGGYAIARKAFAIELPDNYEFSFRLRGESLPNNLEFKLVDASGENVWWVNRRDFAFPKEWRKVTFKKRHIEFAWGPVRGGELKTVAAIELAVTAGKGGQGWIAIDELTLTELPKVTPSARTPFASASLSSPGQGPERAVDGDATTIWRSGPRQETTWLALDFLEKREYGGLILDWEPGRFASRYEVQISEDGKDWARVRSVAAGNGGRDYLFLPETESRYLRLELEEGAGDSYAIREVAIQPLAFSVSPNSFFEAVARDAKRGSYPRYFSGQQSYWTVVGVDGNREEALFSEDGALETGKGGFSIEPFLHCDGSLVTWSDVETTPSLAEGYLPIPSVVWRSDGLTLAVSVFADGTAKASRLYAGYRVKNGGAERKRLQLFLALRPFQVNPSSQFLNTTGGVARIRQLSRDSSGVSVNGGERVVSPLGEPGEFGAVSFEGGDITEYLARGELPGGASAADESGWASGALSFRLDLAPGEEKSIWLTIPLQPDAPPAADPERALAETARGWKEKLGGLTLVLPETARPLADTLRSNLAYILINRDGPAIQPGSRSYERSWIRDGALTSAALLRLGREREVREFLEWYAPYQYGNGKVPCCVDSRGADPVPEHDSHGELIYAIAEYYRFTRDEAFLRKLWPHVEKAVAYLDTLRKARRTAEYRAPGKLRFFGLLPESISHEGYSAKPVHSYWDDFFASKGLEDASFLAAALGKRDLAERYTAIREEFSEDLHASIRRVIAESRTAYLPASADLADFDPTSTSIALSPGGAMTLLPEKELRSTFERYWEESERRIQGAKDWEVYTPYEIRNVGTFVRLGWKKRAQALLDFFMADRRPAGWNHWAEVVGREPRAPRFIGDMPHTWVGSDFIRSFLDMLAFVREKDEALVLAAGVPEEWVRSEGGVSVKGLRTEYGTLRYSLAAEGRGVRLRVSGDGLTVPPGGIAVVWSGEETVLRKLPADVVLR